MSSAIVIILQSLHVLFLPLKFLSSNVSKTSPPPPTKEEIIPGCHNRLWLYRSFRTYFSVLLFEFLNLDMSIWVGVVE